MAGHCSFWGSTVGPFSKVEGLFTVLMCADCQAARGHGAGPYPVMTRAEMRASLDVLPTWALEQKAAAFSALPCERTDLVGGCEAVEEGAGLRALPHGNVGVRGSADGKARLHRCSFRAQIGGRDGGGSGPAAG
jgi:hypothetical protein